MQPPEYALTFPTKNPPQEKELIMNIPRIMKICVYLTRAYKYYLGKFIAKGVGKFIVRLKQFILHPVAPCRRIVACTRHEGMKT